MPSRLPRPLRTALFHALRMAFRLMPMPLATRDKLRQRFLDQHGDLVPSGPTGQLPAGLRARRPYVRSDERAIGYVPYRKEPLPDQLPATLVAFYLPQFHTIPENDEWWGKGFTEWRNVTRALPQFEGHYQPKLPGDLGFYDLRNPEVMREQARLAREYGISAFCFYFYWFDGKTLLETPLRNWLNDKSIELKFCLCWANEKWSRTWDGRGDEILIDQKHSPDDDIAFIEHVAEYLRDPRYLRVDGKPMLLVYRPGCFPDISATADRWRAWCHEHGIGEIQLTYVQGFERPDPSDIRFDSAVQFPPNLANLRPITNHLSLISASYSGQALDWRGLAADFSVKSPPDYPLHAGVNCGWDNEARRPGEGRTYLYATPSAYRDWLESNIRQSHCFSEPPIIFINAWNEWAEGAVLEPDARLGYAYLNATRNALQCSSTKQQAIDISAPWAIVHVWYVDVLAEILTSLHRSKVKWNLLITTPLEMVEKVKVVLSECSFHVELLVVPNRGRDILPFLKAAKLLSERGIDVALKLHTKRSVHRHDGDEWRKDLLDKLVSPDRAAKILEAFQEKPLLGLVAAENHIQPMSYYWGLNKSNVRFLHEIFGFDYPPGEQDSFVGGSMFWVRLDAIQVLLETTLTDTDFDEETGQIDGTLAHAFERVFATCVRVNGYTIADGATLFHLPASVRSPYAYAQKDSH